MITVSSLYILNVVYIFALLDVCFTVSFAIISMFYACYNRVIFVSHNLFYQFLETNLLSCFPVKSLIATLCILCTLRRVELAFVTASSVGRWRYSFLHPTSFT